MSRKKKGWSGPKGAEGNSPESALDRRTFATRFARGVLLWLVPVATVWFLLTPFYNRFLTQATLNLVLLFESPNITHLNIAQEHYFLVSRSDYTTKKGHLSSVRVTDTHFPLIMLGAFFLAVPGVRWRDRFEPLFWALAFSACFHIISLCFWVQFIYATQLGDWSLEHYGTFARNFWGLGKHLLDLPFKLASPLVLWAFFYMRRLMPPP